VGEGFGLVYMYVACTTGRLGLGAESRIESRILDLLRGSMIYNGNAWFRSACRNRLGRVCWAVCDGWTGLGKGSGGHDERGKGLVSMAS
jgi:hypothetical protein